MANACPCCGYMTLRAKPPGTYEICPICLWEDSATESLWENSNGVFLVEAQRNYLAFGACEREWLDSVRAPTDADHRPNGWQTLEEAADTARGPVIAEINRAFDGVLRKEGVTLHEADVIDGYGTEAERQEARLLDREFCWQDVPEADIERYNWILSFLDPKGWRYYMPAYMVWSLKHCGTPDSGSSHATVYSLELDDNTGLRAFDMSRFSILTETQSKAVCSFLRFMRDHGLGYADEGAAKRALKRYWGRFCEEGMQGDKPRREKD